MCISFSIFLTTSLSLSIHVYPGHHGWVCGRAHLDRHGGDEGACRNTARHQTDTTGKGYKRCQFHSQVSNERFDGLKDSNAFVSCVFVLVYIYIYIVVHNFIAIDKLICLFISHTCMYMYYRGDQVVHLKVRIPKKISDTQRELLEKFEAENNKSDDEKKVDTEDKNLFQNAWKRLSDFLNIGKDNKNKE